MHLTLTMLKGLGIRCYKYSLQCVYVCVGGVERTFSTEILPMLQQAEDLVFCEHQEHFNERF